MLLIGTPMIWWGGCIALLFALVMWVGARDWRYGVAVVGTLSTWLPWLQYDDRPIFSFYAIIMLPFIVIAMTLSIGTLIGPSPAPVDPAHGRGGGGRRVRRARAGELRLVLADLDQRAADQQRVAGPDLVLAMGVTRCPGSNWL